MSSLIKLVKVRLSKKTSQPRNITFGSRMTPKEWTLEDCHSLNEINQNIDACAEKREVVVMYITSCVFELPPSGNSTIFENKFPQLESLYIKNNSIKKLTSGTFSYLENLRYLEWINNKTEEIEENTFSGMPSLYSLVIRDNEIQDLKNGIFNGLDQLGTLILHSNGTKTIGKEVFKNMNNLFNLELHDNDIEELNEDIFKDLENLGHLILRNNNLKSLHSNIFKPLKQLNYIDASHNVISELPNNLLKDVSIGGHNANFRYNEIVQINETALEGFSIPSGVLHLGENDIVTLGTRNFYKVTAKTINLRENKIDCIQPGAFERCRCDELILEHNDLGEINPESFRNFKVNLKLTLAHNHVSSIFGLFYNFDTLQELELSFNIISEIPASSFKGLDNLNILLLHNNRIKQIEAGSFSCLPNLTFLTLHENLIEDLPENCFSVLPNLTSLILSSNKLRTIQHNLLAYTPELTELNLMNNEFTELPPYEIYRNVEKLKNINFSFNKIRKLRVDSFASEGDSKEFHTVLLRSCQIVEIESGAFNGINHVEHLVLSGNFISKIMNAPFKGLKSIYKLELKNNCIKSFEYLRTLPPTVIVSLTENPLRHIELHDLNSLDLNQIRVITFKDHSFKRDGDTWTSTNYEIEDIQD